MTETPYGRVDRALHRIAFGALGAQRRLAEIETRMFRDRIDPSHARRPVFVTSLPRAGTTVLLEALAALPEFAAATYRHMPFTLLPLIWTDASRRFQQAARPAERAHGDGLAVGFDSPEAFEETLWMAFWPAHYQGGAIRPWTADARAPEFESFVRQHMAKVVAAGPAGSRRYLSKNNANIARLPLLAAAFPDATVIVPVRDPWAQTASLLRQHRRFLELHARDGFARRYMEGLGHFEFGEALRPIAFGAEPPDPAAADRPEFWLRYWADAYEAVLAAAGPRVVFVDHDRLSRDPAPHLAALAEAIGADPAGRLDAAASRFRPSPPGERPEAPPALLDRVERIHADLRARCLAPRTATVEAVR
jgi:Sulfotransferase family